MKLRATVVVEYEPDPDYYTSPGASIPTLDEMAQIDEGNWREDPFALLASFESNELAITVVPVKAEPKATA